jgi:hypothetical protein
MLILGLYICFSPVEGQKKKEAAKDAEKKEINKCSFYT